MKLGNNVEAEIEEIVNWYDEQRLGLGLEFHQSLKEHLRRIVDNPCIWPVVYKKARRSLMKRFPYVVYYRVDDGNIITILTVIHSRRHPRIWRSRLN